MIAKRKKTEKPKPGPVQKSAKHRFEIKAISDTQSQADAKSKSTGHYNGQAAPRVGDDKKKGTVKVVKPSRVQSGTAKRKSGFIKRIL
jgi:hypothetical protein